MVLTIMFLRFGGLCLLLGIIVTGSIVVASGLYRGDRVGQDDARAALAAMMLGGGLSAALIWMSFQIPSVLP
jgi:multidrug efflux pump subunit AcrB